MTKRYQQLLDVLFRITDATVVLTAWLVAFWMAQRVPLLTDGEEPTSFARHIAVTPLLAAIWMGVFAFSGLYRSGRMRRRRTEVLLILRAHLNALMVFIVLGYGHGQFGFSRATMIWFAVCGAVMLSAFRVLLRTSLRQLRAHGHNLRELLVVGDGPSVQRLVWQFHCFPELGLRVRGIVTRTGKRQDLIAAPVLGCYRDLPSILGKVRVDELLVALPHSEQGELEGLLERLQDEIADIRVLLDVGDYSALGCTAEDFEGFPIVRLNESPMSGWRGIVKRTLDAAGAAFGIIVLSPLLVGIALLVKLSSPGPVFFKQERMGLDGRTFPMLKFRSMRVDAEVASGAVWATKNDTRKTPIGAFLRATSLDELPQLWNVLVGDMSLVGPRPERPVFVQQFRNEIPHYMLRHKVKAGITGWAQVNGWRGDTSLHRRIECDLDYIRNWSLTLDLRILTMTLWKGFVHKNAY